MATLNTQFENRRTDSYSKPKKVTAAAKVKQTVDDAKMQTGLTGRTSKQP